MPAAETCTDPDDEDCDGDTNEEGVGCVCVPNAANACYSGAPQTEGVGICQAGSATCDADGTALGPCVGEVLPGAEDCSTPADEDCDGATPSCPPGTVLFALGAGGTGGDTGTAVAIDPAGNIVVTGYFSGTVDFGGGLLTSAGGIDIFVVKYDPAGSHLWSKRFGDASNQSGQSIATDSSGNVLVTGEVAGSADFGGGSLTSAGAEDIFVAKLDPDGNHLWSKIFGSASPNQMGVGIAADSAGNVLVTGHFLGSANFGGAASISSDGQQDVFVAKLTSVGDHVWSQSFGDAGAQFGSSVAVDALGNVLLTGSFYSTIWFGGATLTSAGDDDIFLAKLDAAGNHLFSQRFGSVGSQSGQDVKVDSSGSVLLTGTFYGAVDFGGGVLTSTSSDVFGAKFDATGNHLWSKRFGDNGEQYGGGVATDPAGDLLLTGHFQGAMDFGGGALTSAGDNDIFVAKLDSAGNHLFSKRFGSTANDAGASIAVTNAGAAVVTGRFQGTVDFGSASLTSSGASDVFVTKLTP